MSKQSYIKSFYKPKSADELKIDQLKSAQLSRASRALRLKLQDLANQLQLQLDLLL